MIKYKISLLKKLDGAGLKSLLIPQNSTLGLKWSFRMLNAATLLPESQDYILDLLCTYATSELIEHVLKYTSLNNSINEIWRKRLQDELWLRDKFLLEQLGKFDES